MTSTVSVGSGSPTVFLLKRSRLRGRLDTEYNLALMTTRIHSTYPQRKIREIASFRTGGTPSKSRPEYWEGNIPWASPKDFGAFYLTQTEDHISQDAVSDSSTTIVPAGTLLVVYRSGVLQHSLPITITTKETAINQDLKALLFKDGVAAEYAGVYFTVFGKRLLPLITKSGATVQSINTEQFEQLGLPIPSRQIQEDVVDQFLRAYESRQKKEEQAQQLLKSIDDILLTELGIKEKPEQSNTINNRMYQRALSEVSGNRLDPVANQPNRYEIETALTTGKYPAHHLHQLVDWVKGITNSISPDEQYVGLENIDGETGSFIGSSSEKETISSALQFTAGHILFPKLRPYLNKAHLAKFSGICSTEFHVLNARGIRVDFLIEVLRSRLLVKLTSLLMTGNTLPRLQVADIERLPIPVPPTSVQEAICERIAKIRQKASDLRSQASLELEQAKQDIEDLILGKETAE